MNKILKISKNGNEPAEDEERSQFDEDYNSYEQLNVVNIEYELNIECLTLICTNEYKTPYPIRV